MRFFRMLAVLLAGLLTMVLLTAAPANALQEKRNCWSGGEEAGICFVIFKADASGGDQIIKRVEVYSYGDESGLEGCPAIDFWISIVGPKGAVWTRQNVLGCGDYHKNFYPDQRVGVNWQMHSTAWIHDNGGFDSKRSWFWSVNGCNPCPV